MNDYILERQAMLAGHGLMCVQDDCLLAIADGNSPPDKTLRQLPPWRAVMIARIAYKANIPLEAGTLSELIAEATKVGGLGQLAPEYTP